MGGGAGVAFNSHFPIYSENIRFAMPENKANFCPDVGSSFFLNQCIPFIAEFAALTGYNFFFVP